MSVALELIAVAPAATCLFIYTLVCALVMAGAQIFLPAPCYSTLAAQVIMTPVPRLPPFSAAPVLAPPSLTFDSKHACNLIVVSTLLSFI